MRTRLKVCCIASAAEAACAVAAGADAIGLVGAMPSGPGPIPDALIAEIALAVPPPVARFLLISSTEPDAVVAHAAKCRVDAVQLVDRVPDATYAALRRQLPALRIVQVIHVEGEDAIAEAKRTAPLVDALLLDSGRPAATTRELGGTGRLHDWDISRRIVATAHCPVFLAGGIGPANVARAVHEVRPFGIDICSGVRTAGALDADKLADVVTAMRGAAAAAPNAEMSAR